MNLSIIPNYDDIFSKLHLAWDAVQTSKSLRIVLIEGESGMKKSHLVRKFLQSSHARYIIGNGSGIPAPYLPLQMGCESMLQLDIVQEQLHKTPEEVPKEWKIALTEFAQVMYLIQTRSNPLWDLLARWRSPSLVPSSSGDDLEEEESGRLKPVNLPELFTRALGELTRLSPVVVFINNLDVTDISTIESLTRNIIPALQDSPLLFITTFEPEQREANTTVSEFVETVRQIPGTDYLRLDPLREEQIQQLLSSDFCWWIKDIPHRRIQALAQRIHTLTGGNFSQVQDLLLWHEKNGAKRICEHLDCIPDFGSFLRQKFAQMSKAEKIFLQMASTQGFYFCLPVVARALKQTRSALEPILSKLTRTPGGWIGLDTVVNFGSGEFTWYHFLGHFRRELVYKSIPQHSRRGYHRKLAKALEEVFYGDTSTIVELLATQFDLADMRNKASFYQAMAAQRANDQGNFCKGLEYAQKGLERLGELANVPNMHPRWCRLMIEKGRAMHTTAHVLMAENLLREAYEAAEDLPDTTLRMDAGRYLGQILLDRNSWDEGIHVIVQSIALAIERKNWRVVIDGIEHLRDRFRRCGYIEAFFEICKMIIDKMSTEARGRRQRVSGEDPGDQKKGPSKPEENFDSILQHLEQAYQESRPDVEPTEQAQVVLAEILHSQGWLHYQLSQNEKALDAFRKALQELEQLEHSERYAETFYKIHRGMAEVYLRTGDFPQALQEVDEAMRWVDASYQRKNQALIRSAKAAVLQLMGRIEEGKQELEMALKMLQSSSGLTTLGEVERDYGFFLYNTIGCSPRARQMYQKSHDHYATAGDFDQMQRSILHLATLDKHQGAFEKALAAYKELLHIAIVQNDKVGQSICRDRIGDIYRIQNHIGNAEQAHINAIQLCDATHNMGGKAIALRSLGQTRLINWDLKQAKDMFVQSDLLYQTYAGPQMQHYRTIMFLGRLALSQQNISEALARFHAAQTFFETVQNLFWLSLCALNQGLAYLISGEAEEALSKTRYALKFLKDMEDWRIGDAHHLLARCYLATGKLKHAQHEIEEAKTQFMKCRLFHRIYQAENTGLAIENASKTKNIEKWRGIDLQELRLNFNHLGI